MQVFISLKKKKLIYHMSLQLDTSKAVEDVMDKLFHEYNTLKILKLENFRIDPIKHKILADRNPTDDELRMAEYYAKKVLYLKIEKKIKILQSNYEKIEKEKSEEKIKTLTEHISSKEKFDDFFKLSVKHGEASEEMGVHALVMESVILSYNENKLFLESKNLI